MTGSSRPYVGIAQALLPSASFDFCGADPDSWDISFPTVSSSSSTSFPPPLWSLIWSITPGSPSYGTSICIYKSELLDQQLHAAVKRVLNVPGQFMISRTTEKGNNNNVTITVPLQCQWFIKWFEQIPVRTTVVKQKKSFDDNNNSLNKWFSYQTTEKQKQSINNLLSHLQPYIPETLQKELSEILNDSQMNISLKYNSFDYNCFIPILE